jgi:hypothetical protein
MTILATRAALAIINSVANPALNIETRNCNVKNLSAIIADAALADDLLHALERLERAIDGIRGLDAVLDHGGDFYPALREARAAVAKAKGEGWNLFDFDNTGLLRIERDDAAQIFASDIDAIEHVRLLAARGDQKALHAIQLHDLNQPKIDALRRNPVTTKGE